VLHNQHISIEIKLHTSIFRTQKSLASYNGRRLYNLLTVTEWETNSRNSSLNTTL